MKTLPIYQVDAFASELFGGNPAAVCPLQTWLPDDVMQKIAAENNLSETAFFVPRGNDFELRWFTPVAEIPLCGHATLASAYILFEYLAYHQNTITFHSMSGALLVRREGKKFVLDFPSEMPQKIDSTDQIELALKLKPVEVHAGKRKLMAVLKNQSEVQNAFPDFNLIKALPYEGVIITSRGDKVDFVSRFFVPKMGIDEDPVTGSAHTLLTPYWSRELNRTEMNALQISSRGGELICRLNGDRVEMVGDAKLYLKGEIFVDNPTTQ